MTPQTTKQLKWIKIDGINYPVNTLLIVWNGSFHFAHYNTAYGKWIGNGTFTSDTINLAQFPPSYFMPAPDQPNYNAFETSRENFKGK